MSGLHNQNRNYQISPRLVLVGCTLILLSLACNLPLMASQSTGDPERPAGFVETSIAETMTVIGRGEPVDAEEETAQPDPPSATFTPESTDTPTLTPTATETPTPNVPKVHISENTNCRTGPGTIYDWLVTVQKGEEPEAVAKDPLEEYWYIRRPGQEGSFCWVWGKYATPVGDTASLPVFTPPPTATPASMAYSIKYISLIGPCPSYALMYQVTNIGVFTLESWKTTMTDHTGGSNPMSTDHDSFAEYSGCNPVNQQVDLTTGESYYLLAIFGNNPQGHDITTKIKICTEDGLGGECLVKTFRHTP